jgi:hypothetical protein
VNYRDLKAERTSLDRFAQAVATLSTSRFQSWSSEDQIAFWVNVYNGLTLLAVIDNYPIEPSFFASLRFPKNSIRQIAGVWDTLKFTVMGRPTTLDQIEHEVLRKLFDEPRIHVALVCAAMGCPPLRNQPYVGNRLDDQLNEQAGLFFGDREKFRIDRQEKTVYLSKILDWYGGDFVVGFGDTTYFQGRSEKERAILNFASGYVDPKEVDYLRNADYRIRFLEYDWTLNEQ